MQDNELDRILDGALSDYSDATPLAGLPQRVLNRVGMAQRRRRWSRCFEAALAIAALVFVGLSLRTPKSVPAPIPTPIPVVARLAIPLPAPAPIKRQRRPRRSVPPKQDRFPSPAPLTGEERSLLALVARSPETFQNVSAEIEIPLIQIPPLESDGSQQDGSQQKEN